MDKEQLKLFLWRWNVEKPDMTNEEGVAIVAALEASWEELAKLKEQVAELRICFFCKGVHNRDEDCE